MIRQDEVYRIGRIGKAHGVKGEVSIHIDDDVFDHVDADYLVLDIDGILVPFYMEEYRFRSDETVLMKFCDIDTMEQARSLTGADVYFPRSLSEADEGGLSWAAIIGFTLTDQQTGKVVGTITAVDDSTINTLFEVERPDGTAILIPAAEDLITDIDTDKRVITIAIPEGLLDIN
ncbi:MAG: 16S rRNA processing protein RimM [Prevotella sp.]|nr:16S rRNA processing protein RimM [Prevotella sp.]